MKNNILKNKRAQVTIFVILAIVIVVGIGLYFVLRGSLFQEELPNELESIYDYYLACIEEEVFLGSSILGRQGGYIEPPNFEPGSEYMPFSNYLNFLGSGVPYWYYVSGNGIAKEQIPSKADMQSELNDYLEGELIDCDFSSFEEQGFNVEIEEPEVNTVIRDNSISADVKQALSISFGEVSWRGTRHSITTNTQLGRFYDLSKDIYLNNKEEMFLENYGVDVLRLYAPVDGTEIGCTPKIWSVDEIKQNLTSALEANVQAIKLKGSYYSNANKYFVQDIGKNFDMNVNLLYSSQWPTRLEVNPSEDDFLIAEPVGLQEGLGVLGFCYVPYHFIYDLGYPVMIQLFSGNEMFQFPIVVYIKNNQPAENSVSSTALEKELELCEYKNQEVTVYTYDSNLDPVEAEISFECLNQKCGIGNTEIQGSNAILTDNFPQCVNGNIIAKAEGYENTRKMYSTTESGIVDIILDRNYDLEIDLKVNSQNTNDLAIISFVGDESKTISWPEMKQVELKEGEYEVSIYVYSSGSIHIPSSTVHKCIDSPKPGIAGFFGGTQEQCHEFTIPSQTVESAISAGGKATEYFVESQLERGRIQLNVDSLPSPRTIDDLQSNYNLLESKSVYIDFI